MTTPVEVTEYCHLCGSTDVAPSRAARWDWVCRACDAARAAKWYAAHRERAIARMKTRRKRKKNTEKREERFTSQSTA